MSSTALEFEPRLSQPLTEEVSERSGQNILSCYQCHRCAGGCPVAETAGVTPDRLIRMVLLGERDAAVESPLVWKCVGCYTCGTRCPNGIQTARINETLKHMSKEAHLVPASPKVAAFHEAFMDSAAAFGRVNEIDMMRRYETKAVISEVKRGGVKAAIDEVAGQLGLGKAMLAKKRMHVGFDRVKGLSEVKGLYRKAKERS